MWPLIWVNKREIINVMLQFYIYIYIYIYVLEMIAPNLEPNFLPNKKRPQIVIND